MRKIVVLTKESVVDICTNLSSSSNKDCRNSTMFPQGSHIALVAALALAVGVEAQRGGYGGHTDQCSSSCTTSNDCSKRQSCKSGRCVCDWSQTCIADRCQVTQWNCGGICRPQYGVICGRGMNCVDSRCQCSKYGEQCGVRNRCASGLLCIRGKCT